ncbi:MAG TPA: DinB family protein [Candidatus Heimdallarchaeota archaeon]|nr:DinB family protein [Candidatus Heimdallarchaeota archaeon]
MDFEHLLSQMAEDAQRIRVLVKGVSNHQAHWKPDPASWSILEVVSHLLDEEKEDFRVRIDFTLHRPDEPWPGIDPEGWVTRRTYNERDLGETLEGFLTAREESLAWLRGLSSPNWDAARDASFGQITAGDFLASWVAHDLLHLRQIVQLHWSYTAMKVSPYRTTYAGTWQ